MRRDRHQQLRSMSLVVATVLLGISWSFALFHVKTSVYPLLWALAMPPLAFWYFSAEKQFGTWKHLPAAALSVYAVVLWQVTRSYGLPGMLSTLVGVLAATIAVWLAGRVAGARSTPASTVPVAPGSGVARRRHHRSAGLR